MKIKRIHTSVALMGKSHKFSFDENLHKLEFNQEFGMFMIDGDTLVPVSNIREVHIEQERKRKLEPDEVIYPEDGLWDQTQKMTITMARDAAPLRTDSWEDLVEKRKRDNENNEKKLLEKRIKREKK